MRSATFLIVIVVACGHASPESAPTPVANLADPATPAPAPAPAPVANPAPPPEPPAVCRTIDGRTGSQYADQIYCQQVGDACCGTMGQVWVCNNAQYVDWYMAHCEPHH